MTTLRPTTAPIMYSISRGGVEYATGQTLIGEITGTLDVVIASDDVNDFLDQMQGNGDQYPPLPPTGQWCEANLLYDYNNDVVICRQSHVRTIFPPEDTPALFTVYQAGGGGGDTLNWIANESVEVGNIREYNATDYRCIQAHVTQVGWEPPNVPALWVVDTPIVSGEWASGVAYVIDDTAVYSGTNYICIQNHVSQIGWEPPNVPALWNVEQTADWQAGVSYSIDDEVEYLGLFYKCLQSHTSQVGWDPPNVPALWLLL